MQFMRGSSKRSSSVRKSKNELLKMSHKDMFMELIRDIASELDVNVLCHKILVNVITLVRMLNPVMCGRPPKYARHLLQSLTYLLAKLKVHFYIAVPGVSRG